MNIAATKAKSQVSENVTGAMIDASLAEIHLIDAVHNTFSNIAHGYVEKLNNLSEKGNQDYLKERIYALREIERMLAKKTVKKLQEIYNI